MQLLLDDGAPSLYASVTTRLLGAGWERVGSGWRMPLERAVFAPARKADDGSPLRIDTPMRVGAAVEVQMRFDNDAATAAQRKETPNDTH